MDINTKAAAPSASPRWRSRRCAPGRQPGRWLAAGDGWQDRWKPTTSGAADGNVRKMFKRICTEAGMGTAGRRGAADHLRQPAQPPRRQHRGDRPAGDASTRTTEIVYRRELRPVITTSAEIHLHQLFRETSDSARQRAFTGTPESHLRLAHAIHANPAELDLGLTGDSHQGDAIGHYARLRISTSCRFRTGDTRVIISATRNVEKTSDDHPCI